MLCVSVLPRLSDQLLAINAQPLEKVKLATLPDSYSSAQS
jgi:hypothetical protein